jgi:pimeloyl-ACP methyl ester carboxylesterase
MADVRASHTNSGRPDTLYGRSHHLMGYFTQRVPKAVFPPLGPLEFKNELPRSLMLRPKQLRAAAEESALLVPTAVKFRSLYESIQRPVRIFHGAEDAIIESKQARDLQRAIGGPTGLFLIKHAGHMVTYADTAAIAEAVNSIGNRNRFRTVATGSQV